MGGGDGVGALVAAEPPEKNAWYVRVFTGTNQRIIYELNNQPRHLETLSHRLSQTHTGCPDALRRLRRHPPLLILQKRACGALLARLRRAPFPFRRFFISVIFLADPPKMAEISPISKWRNPPFFDRKKSYARDAADLSGSPL